MIFLVRIALEGHELDSALLCPLRGGMLHLYLEDADAAYRRALAAGATSLREPEDQFYGDRIGGVQDAFGNQWWLATHIEDVPAEEMQRRAQAQRRRG